MTTILKYRLSLKPKQEIEMPGFALVLSVGLEVGTPWLFVLADPKASKVTRTVVCAATNKTVKDSSTCRFVGTVWMDRPYLASFHFFAKD